MAKEKRDEDARFEEEVNRGFAEYQELESYAVETEGKVADLQKKVKNMTDKAEIRNATR